MKRFLAHLIMLVVTLANFSACCGFAEEEKRELNAAEIFETCVKSTVHIETSSGGGTGFFVSENIVATNNHVIAEAGWMTVKNADGQVYNVTAVLAHSENPDLALLEIDGSGECVRVSSGEVREGEALYCIGAPMGIYPCISDGIVMKRNHNDRDVDYILSNFHSIGGNSGGPVFDAYGEVIGVCVGGYSDGSNSIDLVINAKYLNEMDMSEPRDVLTKEEWVAELNKPEEEKYVKASLNDAQVGQLVSFGRYEQDADTANGPEEILWLVKDRDVDGLTLMSLYCLDVVPYHHEVIDVTWETSDVRAFLNGEFYEKAFSIDEKNLIADSTVINHDNILHGTPGGNDTVDKVYLMSLEEAMEFYGVVEPVEWFYDHIYAQATEYTIQKGVWLEIPDSNRCWWWLRSPGGNPQNAGEIGSKGYLSFNGGLVTTTERAIRPLIQVKVK